MNREEFELTQTLQSSDAFATSSSDASPLTIAYQVAMPQPETHLFEITLQVQGWQGANLDLKMPVWTPGSYLVREYSRHLQNFTADAEGKSLTWRKVGKNHWQIDTTNHSSLTVQYRVFANELTVRTNHLDETHGYFNGAALFFYIPGFQRRPIRIKINPPKADWKVTTALPAVPGQPNTFEAKDFDTLVDSPFEVGQHSLYDFEVLGKPHALAVWGQGTIEVDRVIQEDRKSVV